MRLRGHPGPHGQGPRPHRRPGRKRDRYILDQAKDRPGRRRPGPWPWASRGSSSRKRASGSTPRERLAAHVLGGVGIDDNGLAGVELQYDRLLEGEKGKRLLMLDARRRSYSFETIAEAKPGQDLRLTIDETIQYIAESELEKAVTVTRREVGHRGGHGLLRPGRSWPWRTRPPMPRTTIPPSPRSAANQAIARTLRARLDVQDRDGGRGPGVRPDRVRRDLRLPEGLHHGRREPRSATTSRSASWTFPRSSSNPRTWAPS